jgi:DNA helicase-2/ATP-dependent DNA helicase PcrA
VGKKQKQALGDFAALILKFQTAYKEQDAVSITTDLLLDIDLKSYYENQETIEAKERWANVEELLNSITDFQEYHEEGRLSYFLEEVSLLTDIDRWNESDKAVTLMTIHSAKGLEFPVVMIAGLEEGLFPLGASAYEVEELEEERRLFYVALTRAEKKVYLSYANARRRFGGAPISCIQSRFIHELPENLVDFIHQGPRYAREKPFMHAASAPPGSSYTIGEKVEHKLFGRGEIMAVDGNGDTAKLTVKFSGNVRKKLIAKYAKLVHLQE